MDYRRIYRPGACYFFTVVTQDRHPLLISHIDRLRNAFHQVRSRHPFQIQAIAVLPDHLHAIWQLPKGDDDFSSRWMKIKRLFSSGLHSPFRTESQRSKREKGIWQRRFWEHLIRDDEDWQNHFDYIHYNPVKHGYVSRIRDWPHSSFHRMVEKGWYPEDWGMHVPPQIADMNFE